ncbi:hypothetical protein [Sinomicrobium weinanense]|uniref:DUF1440 domain-containing protein n=1 Tax=Sinomicrobium weinanense TaxID=2842200 RepID=A0A926JTZ0_9FLAO|nr:hypothetical protein [Sinomicrobium weinanense]MBC9797208.1 hypothetical protein [Sinomicrobium weinanense]
MKAYRNPSLKAILLSGLLAGTLDITAAIIQAGIGGTGPLKLLQYVASGIFGTAAFSGGVLFAFYGLVFHYFIAMCWTILFFLVYRKLDLLRYNRIMTGVFYGIFIGCIMNFVVVPLSEVPRGPVRLLSLVLAISILIVAVGLPLSFLAHRFYSRTGKK